MPNTEQVKEVAWMCATEAEDMKECVATIAVEDGELQITNGEISVHVPYERITTLIAACEADTE